MDFSPILHQLEPVEIALEHLKLDPNNPRFTGLGAEPVADEEIASEVVQERTLARMVDEFEVPRLQMNMEVNGYLPIDRIIVRTLDKDSYVVLEGNRRVAAAKRIGALTSSGDATAPAVLESLKVLPALIYSGDETNAAWLFQGLRHITGYEDWSSFNKARLLTEQMESAGLTLTEVGRRFGLTAHGAAQWVRGFYAFKQARNTADAVGDVPEDKYPYFQELFSRSNAKIREWLAWNEEDYAFKNEINFNEFISWLLPHEGPESESPVIAIRTQDQIRHVSFLLREATDIFERFRADRDIDRAYAEARTREYERKRREESDPVADAFDAIDACTKALDDIPYRAMRDPELRQRLQAELSTLSEAISILQEPGSA